MSLYNKYKGHATLDSEQRLAKFEAQGAHGNEARMAEYRRLWVEVQSTRIVPPYPLQMEIELSSKCNLHCPMCFTVTNEFDRCVQNKLMDIDLFKAIINQISGHVFLVRLNWRGEPTLHPWLIDAILYAKSKNIPEVSLVTNGSTLSADFYRDLAEAGLDRIGISVDGLEEEYNKIRFPLKFSSTFEAIRSIKEMRERDGILKPVIKIQTVWPSIRSYPDEYYRTMAPFCDLVAYSSLVDYSRDTTDFDICQDFRCPLLHQRMVVGSDGKVPMCIFDTNGEIILGNAEHSSIYEIWHGAEFAQMRHMHSTGDRRRLNPCKHCPLPRKTVIDKSITIDGRLVTVEKYV